ncbi:MraY family glycosyltransferase [Mucilaginibacter rivuli]|uniref:MraY family glycosyltransferase n=1 Tax=Mucilaginibacter rivuli TaxID=2857527 RepID=UPI002107C96F|nr:glycosyltransferase family 4 protein [Mucilaginibacter rivuli]
MLLYFKIADRYNIIDKPNERSSHSAITIRGGGVIFLFAALLSVILHAEYWLPVLGAFIIGSISFLDDAHTLSGKIRILFHLAAVTLLFLFLKIFSFWPFYYCVMLYILVIGIINAYNFMDGINGITGTYSLVIFLGLQYINLYQQQFINPDLIWLPIVATVVFLFFNFRKRAKCFAGDVGSVSIAFWIAFLLLSIFITTHKWSYILFLAVYGVDSIFTIIHRIILKQNIFKAHRLHFYQLLANEHKIPHLVVSAMYAIIQLAIIAVVIYFDQLPFFTLFIITILPLAVAYLWLKPRLMKK